MICGSWLALSRMKLMIEVAPSVYFFLHGVCAALFLWSLSTSRLSQKICSGMLHAACAALFPEMRHYPLPLPEEVL